MAQQAVILLVEDDRIIRSMMEEALRDEGYHVIACASGGKALGVLERMTPALVLTDMHMETPQAGMQLIQRLRSDARGQGVPAIIYSADSLALRQHSDECERHNTITIGKPFDMLLLLRAVADLLRDAARR